MAMRADVCDDASRAGYMASEEEASAFAATATVTTTPVPHNANAAESTSPPQLPVTLPSTLEPTPPTSESEPPPPPPMQRQGTEEALGPASDAAVATSRARQPSAGPALHISLMLITGARHPYRIDEKYLRSRRVELAGLDSAGGAAAATTFEPRALSGYQLKELILKDWRSEWEPKPASPDSIRLIILGRMIDDKSALKEFPFKLDAVNVVHMTVKPADHAPDEDDAAAKKAAFKSGLSGTGNGARDRLRRGASGERGVGCRCVIL